MVGSFQLLLLRAFFVFSCSNHVLYTLTLGRAKLRKLTERSSCSLSQELQDEEEEIVLNVGGQIEFEVSGPYPSYVSGSTVSGDRKPL